MAFYYLSPPILIVDSCHGDDAYIEAEDDLIWGRDITYGQFEEIQNDICFENVEWNREKFRINRFGRIEIQKTDHKIKPAQYFRELLACIWITNVKYHPSPYEYQLMSRNPRFKPENIRIILDKYESDWDSLEKIGKKELESDWIIFEIQELKEIFRAMNTIPRPLRHLIADHYEAQALFLKKKYRLAFLLNWIILLEILRLTIDEDDKHVKEWGEEYPIIYLEMKGLSPKSMFRLIEDDKNKSYEEELKNLIAKKEDTKKEKGTKKEEIPLHKPLRKIRNDVVHDGHYPEFFEIYWLHKFVRLLFKQLIKQCDQEFVENDFLVLSYGKKWFFDSAFQKEIERYLIGYVTRFPLEHTKLFKQLLLDEVRESHSVLLISGGEINISAIESYLSEYGHIFVTAKDGIDGISLLKKSSPPPDFVFVSLSLLTISGIDFKRWLKRESPYPEIPCFIYSSEANLIRLIEKNLIFSPIITKFFRERVMELE